MATRAPSIVADMTRSRKSSRRPCCTSRAKARPRSASSERSWNSSNSTAATPVEHRVVEHQPREHAFGDHLDPGAARDLRVKPHPHADRIADLLAQRLRHPLGGGARGEPARLQDEDAAAFGPRFAGEDQRHARGLAGAGRGDEHGGVVPAQRRREFRQHSVDRERRYPSSSLPDLIRQSRGHRRMDPRVKPGGDERECAVRSYPLHRANRPKDLYYRASCPPHRKPSPPPCR